MPDALQDWTIRTPSETLDDWYVRLAERMARTYKLTAREHQYVVSVLDGLTHKQTAARWDVSRATVKWHSHNVFVKTLTGGREQLLRKALGLTVST